MIIQLREGVTLNYELSGSGPVVVLSHGFGDSLTLWDEQMEPLSKRFTVLRYDHRGHGASQPPPAPPYELRDLSEDLLSLLSALQIRRAAIVGHSMGGRTMFQFALDHPDMAWALVPVDAQCAPPGPEYRETLLELRGLIADGRLGLFVDRFAAAGELSPRLLSDPERGPRYRERFLRNSPETLLACLDLIGNMPDLTSRLPEIKAPLLAIVGENDHHFLDFARMYERSIREASSVIIPGSTHCPQLDRPLEFNDALTSFLEQTIRRQSRGVA